MTTEQSSKITRDKSPLGHRSVGRPRKRWANLSNNWTAKDTKKNKQFAYIKEWRRRRRLFQI